MLFTGLTGDAVASESPAQALLIRDLEAGLDVRAQVLELSGDPRSRSHVLRRVETRPTIESKAQAELRRALVAALATDAFPTEVHGRVVQGLERVLAEWMLAEAMLVEQQERIVSAGLGGAMGSRIDALLAVFRAAAAAPRQDLLQALDALRLPSTDRALRAQLSALRDGLDHGQAGQQPASRILGAQPPHHAPLWQQRAPRTSPAVDPSYASTNVAEEPFDRASTEDAWQSPEVLRLAQSLGYDYARIHDYVRREIRTEWYAGQMRGAAMTLATGAGNDVDQASLLVALLRASGAAARYVHGVVEIEVERLEAQLGIEGAEAVGRALTRAGIANEPYVAAGRIAGFRLEHTWVSARVPYANYRGSVVDASGMAWIPLAPAIKPHDMPSTGPGPDAIGVDADALLADYLGEAPPQPDPADRVRALALAADPSLDIESLLAAPRSAALALDILPNTLPFRVVAVFAEDALLDAEHRQWVHLRMHEGVAETSALVLDQHVPMTALYERRLTLSHIPASTDDQDLIHANGGWDQTPPALLRLRPVLHADGVPLAVGDGVLQAGTPYRVRIVLRGPGGETDYRQTLLAGGFSALHLGDGRELDGALEAEPEIGESETRAARLLGGLVRRYVRDWTRGEDTLAALFGVRALRPLPGLMLVTIEMDVDRVLGVPISMDMKGVSLDAALKPVELIGGDDHARRTWYRLAALHGSVLEHRVFQRQWGVLSVSADRVMALATTAGVPVLDLAPGTALPDLPLADDERVAIQGWLGQGYRVRLPTARLGYNAWTGIGWLVEHPLRGESGYFLSGHWAGGATTEAPEHWVIAFIAQALRYPYGSEPNLDPSSVARLRAVPASDQQVAVAGSEVDRALTVIATDRFGRPVQGAEVVFSVISGGGGFPDGEGSITTTTTRVSSAHGVVAVPFRASERTGNFLRLLNVDDTFATRVGFDVIAVGAVGEFGPVALPQPMHVVVVPGPPARIERRAQPNLSTTTLGGMYSGPLVYRVLDALDNPVANAELQIDAGPDDTSCASLPNWPTRLALPGMCGHDILDYMGSGCGSVQVVQPSDDGGQVQAMLLSGNAVYYSTSIRAETGAIVDTWDIVSPFGETAPPDVCNNPARGEAVRAAFYFEATSPLGVPIEATRPGEVLGAPRRIGVGCGLRNGSFHWPLDGNFDWDAALGHAWSAQAIAAWRQECNAMVAAFVADVSVDHGGSATSLAPVRNNVYQFAANAGPLPTQHMMSLAPADGFPDFYSGYIGTFFAVDGEAVIEDDGEVYLSDFGVLLRPLPVLLEVRPDNYRPNALLSWIQEVGEQRDWSAPFVQTYAEQRRAWTDTPPAPLPPRAEPLRTEFAAGTRLDPDLEYEVAALANVATPWEVALAPAALSRRQRIFRGYDVTDDGQSELLAGFPYLLNVFHDTDVARQELCDEGRLVRFAVNHQARVSMRFMALEDSGHPADEVAWMPLDEVVFEEGTHGLELNLAHLPFGDYAFELVGHSEAFPGLEEIRRSRVSVKPDRRDHLPLAHPIVKGVDLFDGGLSLVREDIALGGRGPGLRFVRSYASHRGLTVSELGSGWTHNYAASLRVTPCGEYVVSGADGQSMAFVLEGEVDGRIRYRGTHGYHGSLYQNADGSFDFHPVGGTLHRFAFDGPMGMALVRIEDTHGNGIRLEHIYQGGQRLLRLAEDDAGRRLEFEYTPRDIDGRRRWLLARLRGPEGFRVDYDYDDEGNLVEVRRSQTGAAGEQAEGYGYRHFQALVDWGTAQRPPSIYRFGHRLETVENLLDGAVQSYAYTQEYDHLVGDDGSVSWVPVYRVASLTEPDHTINLFRYPGGRGLGPVAAEVEDGRHTTTFYQLDAYGAATEITGPAGTERFEWDPVSLKPGREEDANGTVREYQYDAYGNRTLERVTSAHGVLERSWTHVEPEFFAKPGIRDRVRTETDFRGIVTTFSYDPRGNPTAVARGGVSESYAYDARGDRIAHTDGFGHTRQFGYDPHGHLTSVSDSFGSAETRTFDALGRMTRRTDGEGFSTTHRYDALGRMIETVHPDGATESVVYDDVGRRRIETNARDFVTEHRFDAMGRVLAIEDSLGVIATYGYDANGNVESETDANGNETTHVHDDANRRIRSLLPEGVVLEFGYDPVGHLVLERRGDGTQWRIAEYEYQHPEYHRTHERRRLGDEIDGRWIETVSAYDGNGNRVRQTDPLGRITNWTFDDRDRLTREEAPEGRVQTFAYDGADRQIEATLHTDPAQVRRRVFDGRGRERETLDASGARWVHQYDRRNLRTETLTPRGGVQSFEYDVRGRLERQSGPEVGQFAEYGYDENGNRIAELQANGRLLEATYDARDRLATRRDQIGPIETLTYDGHGNLRQSEDALGRVTTHVYDGLHRRTQSLLPENRQLDWSYSVHGEVLTETNARRFVTTHTYDSLGRRTATEFPNGDAIAMAYDDAGNLVEETNARGHVTTQEYDGLNRRTAQTDPLIEGETQPYRQTWTYDPAGNILVHVDRRGIETRHVYDRENRPTETRRAGILLSQRFYDGEGNLQRELDAEGRETSYTYDLANRRLRATRPLGAESTWTYSPLDDVLTETDPDGYTQSFAYDLRQRLVLETDPAGAETTHAYDLADRRIETERPEGGTWVYTYDAADRLETVTDPESNTTTYGYDPNGNRTEQTDARQHTTRFEFDERDRLELRRYHDGTQETFAWDENGNRTRHTDANGQVRTFDYDALDRQTQAHYPAAQGDEAHTVTYRYDPEGHRIEVRESASTGGTGVSTFTYDAFGRVETETDRFGQTTSHVYDRAGNRTQRHDPTGTTHYGIDALDRIETLTAPGRGAVQYTYTPGGRVTQIDQPDGTRTEQTYDEAGRIAQISHYRGGQRQAHYAYTYDGNGNRLTQIEDLGQGERLTEYAYDQADRLIETVTPEGRTEYVLDEVANRIEERRYSGNTLTEQRTLHYDDRDRLMQVTGPGGTTLAEYTYDANGNRIAATEDGQARSFSFGARDRLLGVHLQGAPPESGPRYRYNDAGFRIEETRPGAGFRFRYDGSKLAYETNVLNNPLVRYDHGPDRLLAETRNSTTLTWLTDALRTPVKRLTSTGSPYSTTRYDEYGKVIDEASPDTPRFGFTGYQRSEGTDLYYAEQRWYDAGSGRFVSEDPLWGDTQTPLSLHRYLYAYANPTVYVDPDGRMGLPNSWEEMPGYVKPEPNELHYQGGSPEARQAALDALSPEQLAHYYQVQIGGAQKVGALGALAVGGGIVAKGIWHLGKTGYQALRAGMGWQGAAVDMQLAGAAVQGEVAVGAGLSLAGAGELPTTPLAATMQQGRRLLTSGLSSTTSRNLDEGLSALTPVIRAGDDVPQVASLLRPGRNAPTTQVVTEAGLVDVGRGGVDVRHSRQIEVPFGRGVGNQGFAYENAFAAGMPAENRLPPNFKTFDFLDRVSGVATSVKTLDTTTASRLTNPQRVYSSLRSSVNAAANFDRYRLGPTRVTSADIGLREVRVAVPLGTTAEQWAEIARAMRYAEQQGVRLVPEVVTNSSR